MKSRKEISEWILENCVDSVGVVDLSGMNFVDRNVIISEMKANVIYQNRHEANEIWQSQQKAKKIYQNYHRAEEVHEGKHTKTDNTFIGKRLDNGQFTQGYLFEHWGKSYILWGLVNEHPDMIEVDPKTVRQYTTLNGESK